VNSSPDNPPANRLSDGLSAEQLENTIKKSGYPLQSVVAATLKRWFLVQQEWGYVDKESGGIPPLDVFATLYLYDYDASRESA